MAAAALTLAVTEGGFALWQGDRLLAIHDAAHPMIAVGRGVADVEMFRGNFRLSDTVSERTSLTHAKVLPQTGSGDVARVEFSRGEGRPAILSLVVQSDGLLLEAHDRAVNRCWLTFHAEPDEKIYGLGEQMSYLDLRGRVFPVWTSEPGVGRDKSTAFTQAMDEAGNAGGDYWTTNYPQPTILSSRNMALHVDTHAYCAFDFTAADSFTVECWDVPHRIETFAAAEMVDLVSTLASRFGRQPLLPEWATNGAIIGLKQGQESFARLEKMIDAGVPVSGLWCEDWVGLRITSFGKRLFWDWKWNRERYPDLYHQIARLAAKGVRFLGYVNPYLAIDGTLYQEALAKRYLALHQDEDAPYHVDFGEFDAAIVDFANPAAAEWFADRVIGQEMLDFGLSGWMADFGEYLPTDVRLFDGSDPMLAHNAWPTLWAKVNARALELRGKTGDAVFFMRAGGTDVGRYCPLLWAGDQSVDFSRHDGIGTVITAALSSGLVGNAYSHSDIGGYTSLLGNVRTAELLMRWSELAAFTPVMRTHEGNRPDENLQVDSTPELLAHFAAMTQLHADLAPYTRALCIEARDTGLPLQRPLFLHHEDDMDSDTLQTQYLYGQDLLIAPVIAEGARRWRCYLPCDATWVHLWTGMPRECGFVEVEAPFGRPPVFYRSDSRHAPLFTEIAARHVARCKALLS
ncbi:alpha-glucosidase [Sphingobium sp. SCG-1]|uniref:alpha-glucosidase n=1 Tax=Sphingobium sp. SCG-1 TaxID=2072936 RepID=UPI000CD6A9B1|nr:alpha-glucosidase [Sphingobium sp. SCG-1]AUW57632.1 alpha-glucosidase [Sphingobium sp. SCG-1]